MKPIFSQSWAILHYLTHYGQSEYTIVNVFEYLSRQIARER